MFGDKETNALAPLARQRRAVGSAAVAAHRGSTAVLARRDAMKLHCNPFAFRACS